MIPPYSWAEPRQEPGNVDERDDRDAEGVAEPHEPRRLDRALDVEAAGQHQRLIRHETHAPPADPPESDHDVPRVVGHQLEEVRLVHDLDDQLLDVVRRVRIARGEGVERGLDAVDRIVRRYDGRLAAVA